MTKLLKYAVVPILCIAVCVTVVFIVRGTGKKGGADVELLREGAGDEELADYAQTVLKLSLIHILPFGISGMYGFCEKLRPRRIAVSYTHLDVYKRQCLGI